MKRIPAWFLAVACMPVGWANAGELARVEPAEVGLSASRLKELTPALRRLVDEGKIPGGVALVARHGKIAYLEAFGDRDLAAKTPMTLDTIFAIASMTKPITCIAVMQLVEQGKLTLDAPISTVIPEFRNLRVMGDPKDDTDGTIATVPARREVTLRDLLSHTSGIAYAGMLATDERLRKVYDQVGLQRTDLNSLPELITRLTRVPLAHQPGERWTYGLSHDVLGRVVEVASGQPFDQYLQEHILGPLNMVDTSFLVPESKRDRVATIYLANVLSGKLRPAPRSYGSATFPSGGGGLFSTVRDYTRFAQMLLNGGTLDGARILKTETLARMTTNQIDGHTAFGMFKYGLGFGLEMAREEGGDQPVMSRFFWGGLFSTNFWVDPRHDVVAVILTQVLPTNHGGAVLVLRRAVDSAIRD